MLRHRAAVLDYRDPSRLEPRRARIVSDAGLEPHALGLPRERQDLVDVAGQVGGCAEHVDQIDALG